VTQRRGFGDETWRLAREGDAAALHKAADLLLRDPGDLTYEGHRARAFALAVQGADDQAAAELHAGWTDEWPFPAQFAIDVARIHWLAGDCERALDSLLIAARGASRLDAAAVELVADCVRRRPALAARALRVAFAGGTAMQKLETAGAVVRARFRRS
jgi:hypothetical protein